MTRHRAAFLPVVASLLGAMGVGPAMTTRAATLRYEEVKDWPRLPAGLQMGEAAGVAVDSNGHVFVFHRPGRGFDPSRHGTARRTRRCSRSTPTRDG